MREIGQLAAEARERLGKGGSRTLRRAGRVPGVVYGGSEEPLPVSLNLREVTYELHKPGFFTRLVDLAVAGRSIRVLPRDVQFNPVSDAIEHVDFQRYVAGQKVHIAVPVRFVGEARSPGLKRGGVLNVVRHEVELVGEIERVPEEIVLSVDGLEIGDSLHMSAVKLPEGITPAITDRDFTIATIAAPTIVKVEAEEAAVAAAAAAAAVAEGVVAAPVEGEAVAVEGEAPKAEAKPARGEAKPTKGEAKPAKAEAKPTKAEGKTGA